MKILIMAGGTGGHIFPALAVATSLISNNVEVAWLGSQQGMEYQIVTENKITFYPIEVRALRGKGFKHLMKAPFFISKAVYQSICVLLDFKPDLVLGMGGYVSGPGAFAAKLLGIKLVIHEQNSIPGLTNKLLSKFSYKVLSAFPNAFPANNKTIVTGNPVRNTFKDLASLERHSPLQDDTLKILCVGGSRGARALNEILPKVALIWPNNKKLKILHQTGTKDVEEVINKYSQVNKSNVSFEVVSFIDDMAKAYIDADLVISRAGALTVTEIATIGVASILIPYPYAVDDHQTANAKFLVAKNAAILLQEKDLNVDKLFMQLINLTTNPQRLLTMAANARKLAMPDAVDKVVAELTA